MLRFDPEQHLVVWLLGIGQQAFDADYLVFGLGVPGREGKAVETLDALAFGQLVLLQPPLVLLQPLLVLEPLALQVVLPEPFVELSVEKLHLLLEFLLVEASEGRAGRQLLLLALLSDVDLELGRPSILIRPVPGVSLLAQRGKFWTLRVDIVLGYYGLSVLDNPLDKFGLFL